MIILLAFAVAMALGFFVGWAAGRHNKASNLGRDIQRDEALRENAQVDFEFVRTKADEIIRLASDISKRAKTAHDTVLIPHADIDEKPRMPDVGKSGGVG
jgi:hypothetical protein